ncbi:lasso RiPP family leader peptide-containing protein [Stenotrophomonas sp. NPDC087984]
MEAHLTYETPALVEVGDFTDCTLGIGDWGWDWTYSCMLIC